MKTGQAVVLFHSIEKRLWTDNKIKLATKAVAATTDNRQKLILSGMFLYILQVWAPPGLQLFRVEGLASRIGLCFDLVYVSVKMRIWKGKDTYQYTH